MKKPKKVILSVIGLIIAVLIIPMVIFTIRMKSETGSMSPLKTGEVVDGVFAVKDEYSNMYLIKNNDTYIAVDAGKTLSVISEELKKINIDPLKVSAVLLTHTDSDHTAALDLFKKAVIYISKDEEQMIKGQTHRFFIFNNSMEKPYRLLGDDQVINIEGLKIKGILTPGHTPGSMCYVINDKYLFTGDSMMLADGKTELFNEFFNMDTDTQKKSLPKIANIPGVQYVFTAHYGYSDNYMKAIEKWK